MLIFLLSCQLETPCKAPLAEDASLIDLFVQLEEQKCLHPEDLVTLATRMDTYHRQTTLHCDAVYRRSSIDGKKFDGPEEKVLTAASVADIYIDKTGRHILVYNDTNTNLLVETATNHLGAFWERGLIGFGGLGLAIDAMNETPIEYLKPNLQLDRPLELVDPDIGQTIDGKWRIDFFAVAPTQMNRQQFGPMASEKPHHFYRTVSPSLETFPTPSIIVSSSTGSTGGADPAILTLLDGSEILYVGPLDHTTMGWVSPDGVTWPTTEEPTFNSRMPFATPDAVVDPEGGYRLYGMRNGRPGEFLYSHSKDGIHFNSYSTVLIEQGAFNISVGVDPVGVWWAYYNKTDLDCVEQWGARKVLPTLNHRSVDPR